jgi:hypothetical protein
MVEAVCPEDYKHMKSAHEAGHWVGTALPTHPSHNLRSPGGCMLASATLYKLQTGLHRDVEDDWCAIVNDGRYSGGEALFPDLALKLKYILLLMLCRYIDYLSGHIRYSPGHVIIFRSSALYHAVAKWTASQMEPGDIFTPGRLSWVYFNHKHIVDFLQDKPKGWFKETAGGFFGASDFGTA